MITSKTKRYQEHRKVNICTVKRNAKKKNESLITSLLLIILYNGIKHKGEVPSHAALLLAIMAFLPFPR